MNSALKPVLPQPGVPQPGGSPAKGNVANANHAVGLPQGAQNSLHLGTNNLVGQNLTHHIPNPPPLPAHAVPSMAPVSANMAQMAQNMSHHGNLSHTTQNSVAPTNVAASPNKNATTSAPAPLSLVQDKPATTQPPQPLALTRTPEKKEAIDSTAQANGPIDSPKSGNSAPALLKPQNPETKDKPDIAKTSPSTPKPPEKSSMAQIIPQKADTSNVATPSDGPAQPKVATANEPPEKSPSKPIELKSAQTADVAPRQSDNKPALESANESQSQSSAIPLPQKESVATESPKPEPTKSEENGESQEKLPNFEVNEQNDNMDSSKPEENKALKGDKPEEKSESRTSMKTETKIASKSTLKLATVTPPMRKRRQVSEKTEVTSAKKQTDDTPDTKSKRNRTKVQLYQSPTPEIAMATKLSASAGRSTPTKQTDDKLIVIYKNEYLAVRNAEGGFYVCQALQNVYRTTRKIKIRWLSQDKADPTGETYKPDFYDVTDMECVLTTISLTRSASGGGAWLLRPAEQARATSILQRALKAEQSGANFHLTEEHPDGLDLSLYTDESQLEKKSRKRTSSKSSPKSKEDDTSKEEATPSKKARTTPKRSPRSAKKRKSPKSGKSAAKAKSSGSTPSVAVGSKTATAVTEKTPIKKAPSRPAKSTPAKTTPAKTTPTKTDSPITRKGRKAAKETKSSPIVPTPSTSTGKTTRTPRKPPSKK